MLFLIVVVCIMFVIIVFVNYFTEPNLKLVHTVFSVLSSSCRNYIGYNNKYGFSFVRNHTCSDHAIARLISEIRDNSIYVPGCNCCILNHMARVASSN